MFSNDAWTSVNLRVAELALASPHATHGGFGPPEADLDSRESRTAEGGGLLWGSTSDGAAICREATIAESYAFMVGGQLAAGSTDRFSVNSAARCARCSFVDCLGFAATSFSCTGNPMVLRRFSVHRMGSGAGWVPGLPFVISADCDSCW